MKYEGKIYGKVAGKYIEVDITEDLDKAKKYDELKAENDRLRAVIYSAIEKMLKGDDNGLLYDLRNAIV